MEFQRNIEPVVPNYYERNAYIELFSNINKAKLIFNCQQIVNSFGEQFDSIDSLNDFIKLKNIFSSEFEYYTNGEKFNEKLHKIIQEEIDNTGVNDFENMIDELKNIQSKFKIPLESEINELSEKRSEFMAGIDAKVEEEMDDYKYQEQENYDKIEKENIIITNLFESIINNY